MPHWKTRPVHRTAIIASLLAFAFLSGVFLNRQYLVFLLPSLQVYADNTMLNIGASNSGATALGTLSVTGVGSTAAPAFTVGNGSQGYMKIGASGWYDDGSYFSPLGSRNFYIRDATGTTYLYSANTYLGSTSGDAIHLRGNTMDGSYWTIQSNGNVGIGSSAAPAYKLDVTGTARATAFASGTSVGSTTQCAGGEYMGISQVAGGIVAGTPSCLGFLTSETDPQVGAQSTSYVPRWNGSALVNGTIYDDGTNVGIGTAAPVQKLDVNGQVNIRDAGGVRFAAANPYIYATSYFIAPGGAYFNSGTVYAEATIQARGGIADDGGALVLNDSPIQFGGNGRLTMSDDGITMLIQSTGDLRTLAASNTWLRANGDTYIDLDEDNNGTNNLYVRDGANNHIMTVAEGSNINLTLNTPAGANSQSQVNLVANNSGGTAGTWAIVNWHGSTGSLNFFDGMTSADMMKILPNSNVQANYSFVSNAFDLAENVLVQDRSIESGDVVVAVPSGKDANWNPDYNTFVAAKAGEPYSNHAIGVISENPGFMMRGYGFKDEAKVDEKSVRPLSLSGRVPVKVSTINGPIKAGDPLTTSSIPGVAMKATRPGMIIGRALDDYTASGTGKVLAMVTLSWYDPDASLTDTGDLKLAYDAKGNPSLTRDDSPITRIGAFAKAVAAQLDTGIVRTKTLIVDGIDIVKKLNELSAKIDAQEKEIRELKAQIETLKQK